MIKLVAVDMDGTLLNSKKEYPKDFPSWVKSHKGVKTVLASGRQYYCLRKQFDEIKDDVIYIAENGGVVFMDGKVIYEDSMSPLNARLCLDTALGIPGCTPLVCGVEATYYCESTPEILVEATKYYDRLVSVKDLRLAIGMDRILKIAVFVEDFKAQAAYDNLPELPEDTEAVLSGDSWVDIANKGVSKGPALKFLLEKLDISRNEAAAFGDFPNDITMLKAVGESYAMLNAHPDVIDIAKHVTLKDNEEEGVMYTLRSLEKNMQK